MVWVFGGFDIAAKNEDAERPFMQLISAGSALLLSLLEFAGRHG